MAVLQRNGVIHSIVEMERDGRILRMSLNVWNKRKVCKYSFFTGINAKANEYEKLKPGDKVNIGELKKGYLI